MNRRAEVVVIGGGPAGSAAATTLARRGASVVLVERDRDVRPKVCGEFVSVEACAEARALGVDPAAFGAATIDGVRVAWRGMRARAALPFVAASLSRERFDRALLDAARNAGVDVRMGTRATGVGHGYVSLAGDGEADKIVCDHVVLASGKLEFGERRAAAEHDAIGFKMHYAMQTDALDALGTTVDLVLFDGGYAGMQRIEEGLVAFAFVIDPRKVPAGNAWAAVPALVDRASPQMGALLAGAQPRWPKPLAISGVPYGFTYRGKDGAPSPYRAGDAFAVIPSFTGDGLAIALVTGREAARAILRGETAAAYHTKMRSRVAIAMRVAGALSVAIRSPLGRAAVVAPARVVPSIFSLIATATRIAR